MNLRPVTLKPHPEEALVLNFPTITPEQAARVQAAGAAAFKPLLHAMREAAPAVLKAQAEACVSLRKSAQRPTA